MFSQAICFDARMLKNGGIGTYVRNLLPGIKEHCRNLKVIVNPEHLATESWLAAYDLIFTTASIYSVQEQIKIPFLVPSVDLYFSPHFNVPVMPLRAKYRLVTIHDVFHLAYLSTLKWSERIYARGVIHQAVTRSKAIITDSEFSREEICRFTRATREKITVIPCGVDQELFKTGELGTDDLKVLEKFKIPEKFFLFVGNLKPHKNLKGLLESMHMLINAGGSSSLVIVGKAERMKNVESVDELLKQFPALNERVICLSSVENKELPSLYRSALALVFPSFYEGFGLPVLEAMSCGCPVISSLAASLPEICGNAALLVHPDNSKEIFEAMRKITHDIELRRKLQEIGYKNVAKFTWKNTLDKHLNVMESVFR